MRAWASTLASMRAASCADWSAVARRASAGESGCDGERWARVRSTVGGSGLSAGTGCLRRRLGGMACAAMRERECAWVSGCADLRCGPACVVECNLPCGRPCNGASGFACVWACDLERAEVWSCCTGSGRCARGVRLVEAVASSAQNTTARTSSPVRAARERRREWRDDRIADCMWGGREDRQSSFEATRSNQRCGSGERGTARGAANSEQLPANSKGKNTETGAEFRGTVGEKSKLLEGRRRCSRQDVGQVWPWRR